MQQVYLVNSEFLSVSYMEIKMRLIHENDDAVICINVSLFNYLSSSNMSPVTGHKWKGGLDPVLIL